MFHCLCFIVMWLMLLLFCLLSTYVIFTRRHPEQKWPVEVLTAISVFCLCCRSRWCNVRPAAAVMPPKALEREAEILAGWNASASSFLLRVHRPGNRLRSMTWSAGSVFGQSVYLHAVHGCLVVSVFIRMRLCLHEEWCWFDVVLCEFSAVVTPMVAVLPNLSSLCI